MVAATVTSQSLLRQVSLNVVGALFQMYVCNSVHAV